MKNINQKVNELLEKYTQRELAEEIGVSQATISDLSTGKQKDIGIERGGRKLDLLHALHCSEQKAA